MSKKATKTATNERLAEQQAGNKADAASKKRTDSIGKEAPPSDHVSHWQQKLLPFMIAMPAVMTVFFLVASFVQLYALNSQISDTPRLELKSLDLVTEHAQLQDDKTRLDAQRWQTLSTMESYAVERRYHLASVLLMTRVWLKYLGFLTGMIMALIGATFILGKLRESGSTLATETTGWKLSLQTSSPGLFLAVLGATLMLVTAVTHNRIEVEDSPLYISNWVQLPTPTIKDDSAPEPWLNGRESGAKESNDQNLTRDQQDAESEMTELLEQTEKPSKPKQDKGDPR